ncbi:hypothetical protein [Flavobacterium microcysteis]|uniref:Uncharacterized protein n=1 Tax=Flavobacterium microcysteis TaxID=2596891 RepID=A0A501Q5U0_9FLAO|nr:hypothetical protein [Flavobacterium microcysteis]TPD67281.1 hypothetical protein FJA49_13490 [Flavobacterium microcysteis]
MADYLFDQKKTKDELRVFFKTEKAKLNDFGSAVNQTFEAYVFAKVIEHYKELGCKVKIINPKVNGESVFKLKFSTRGAPSKYSYALVEFDDYKFQVRHQLRISTKSDNSRLSHSANICCDISIIEDNNDLDFYSTDDALPNGQLISFGEVKHMSAFAELVASFIGLVHELQPSRLRRIRTRNHEDNNLAPFLYVSGYLNPTARGIFHSIQKRKYDLDIYSYENPMK